MRELKFRAWSNEYKLFYYDAAIENGEVVLLDYDFSFNGWHGVKAVIIDDGIIEQYTGLKDKNGKEIYEGDIIREKWFDEDVRRGENRVGKVEYFTDGFVCWFVGGRFIPLGMFPVSHIEVIGNIHDNPELLKKEK